LKDPLGSVGVIARPALLLGPEAVSFPGELLAKSLPYESGNFRIAITSIKSGHRRGCALFPM
jgi:hypothetical protein